MDLIWTAKLFVRGYYIYISSLPVPTYKDQRPLHSFQAIAETKTG